MTEAPASERSGAGQGLAEHFLAWIGREAPDYLAALQRAFGARAPHEGLAVYFKHGSEGLFAGNYRQCTGGHLLHFDTAELLRRWVDEALIAGPAEVRWRSDDPGADWSQLQATQLQRLCPETAPRSVHSELDLMHRLETLLPDLYAGVIDFGGRKYLCRVFERPSLAERSDHPTKSEVEARPTQDPVAEPQSEATSADTLIYPEAEAAWEYITRLARERESTGRPPTRRADYAWRLTVRSFHVTQDMIDLWRSLLLTPKEKRGGAPPR